MDLSNSISPAQGSDRSRDSIGSSASIFPSSKWIVFWLALFSVTLFSILLSAPPRLGQNNEERMSEYVFDAVSHGNWICQKDADGQVCSKPPMSCWISSVATLFAGEINRFTLYLPSALAAVFLSWIIFFAGKNQFGWRAGFLGGSIYLLSNVAVNEMATARFDALFALFVTLGAMAAFRAWMTGRGWIWFWLAAAGATLTKGPLGIILSAAGLLAIFFQKGDAKISLRGSHLAGIILFFLIAGGWFALSYWKIGRPLVDKMIFQELVGHAAGDGKSRGGFYKPALWFLSDFGPWSLFSLAAFWRIWKYPAVEPRARCFERFLFCWFGFGLFLFSVGGHERSRLLFPIVPAAALLAGNELARITKSLSLRILTLWVAIGAIGMLGAVAFYYHVQRAKTHSVIENVELRNFAHTLENKFGKSVSIKHVDSPFPLRFYLKNFEAETSIEEAAKLLAEEKPVLLAASDFQALKTKLGSNATQFFIVAQWPETGEPRIQIISNVPIDSWPLRK